MADMSDAAVMNRNQSLIADWSTFFKNCEQLDADDIDYLGDDPWDESDFKDLAVGFFIGKGATFRDAFALAIICRYKLNL